jgi:hypothetical protein
MIQNFKNNDRITINEILNIVIVIVCQYDFIYH